MMRFLYAEEMSGALQNLTTKTLTIIFLGYTMLIRTKKGVNDRYEQ